jgi:hypothetical protein
MRRCGPVLCLVLAAAVLLAGCGGTKASPTTAPPVSVPTTTAAQTTAAQTTTAGPTLTSAADIAACLELARNLKAVSTMTQSSVDYVTQSLHPKQLAQRVGTTVGQLRYGAQVMSLTPVPRSLEPARAQLVAGLRRFANDFARAQKYFRVSDMASGAAAVNDPQAVAQITTASHLMTKGCG